MEQKKTHWKKLINPAYLGAYSLDPNQDKTVTIDRVVREMVTSSGGKKEECSVAYIKGDKPLILNATNSKTIAGLYGPYVEDWAGRQITLFASTTRLAGETVECLRIRAKVPEKVKQSLSAERFQAGLNQIAVGEYSAERMRANFILTAAQEAALSAHIQKLVNGEIDEPEQTISDSSERAAPDNDQAEGVGSVVRGSEDSH